MELVTQYNLSKGRRVIDEDGEIGTIIECSDVHNVEVKGDNGGFGLYCFSKGCNENSEYEKIYYL
jgi:hypothetical protein